MAIVTKKVLKFWEVSAAIALLISLSIFISDLIFHFDHHIHQKLQIVEIIVAGIFICEVAVQLIYTDTKLLYIKKNWIYILTIIPLIGMLRIFKFGKAGRFIKFFEFVAHSKVIKGESAGAKMMEMLTPATMAYHLKRADFKSVPKNLNIIYMHRYVSPKADPSTTKGISEGMKTYMRMMKRKKLVFIDGRWDQVDLKVRHSSVDYKLDPKLLDSHLEKESLVITDRVLNSYDTSGELYGKATVFSTFGLEHVKEDYAHLDINAFRKVRGMILGYNTLAHVSSPCYHHSDCLHKKLNKEYLDIYSFRNLLTNRLPLCEYHDVDK